MYLRFLKLDALLGVEEVVAPAADDAVAGPVSIDPDFPFGDSNQMQFYVSLTLNNKFNRKYECMHIRLSL